MKKKTKLSQARKQLLTRLELIIGSECYNGNIQNWGPGGVFEGEGRHFRYPLTIREANGMKRKCHSPADSLPDAAFRSGYYAFGANELHIMRALERAVAMLERENGLVVEGKSQQ